MKLIVLDRLENLRSKHGHAISAASLWTSYRFFPGMFIVIHLAFFSYLPSLSAVMAARHRHNHRAQHAFKPECRGDSLMPGEAASEDAGARVREGASSPLTQVRLVLTLSLQTPKYRGDGVHGFPP
jgi:hypothetical protein